MNDSKDNTNNDQLLDFSLIELDLKNIAENEHEINGKIAAKGIKRLIKKIRKSGQKPDLEKIKNSLTGLKVRFIEYAQKSSTNLASIPFY